MGDIESRDGEGMTPLMFAAEYGCADIVRLLLDNGANIESKDGGITALYCAAINGNDEVVKLLIRRGANLHIKDIDDSYSDSTPLDEAKECVVAIIEAAVKSTEVIYASSNELQPNRDYITFRHFNNNIIILSDNDIPDGFEFEGHPVFSLRHLRQFIDQPPPTSDNDENNFHQDAIHSILAEKHPAIVQRLQHWEMNPLHLITYLPQQFSNDAHGVTSSLLTKCPQAITSIDIDGMTPLHHAAINLLQRRISQECYDLLLERSPPIVVHQAIKAGMDWEYLHPILMTKLEALTMEDEESGLVTFMLAAKRYKGDDNDDAGMLCSLSMAYELLCLQPDVMKLYDESNMTSKRSLDEISLSNDDQNMKRCSLNA